MNHGHAGHCPEQTDWISRISDTHGMPATEEGLSRAPAHVPGSPSVTEAGLDSSTSSDILLCQSLWVCLSVIREPGLTFRNACSRTTSVRCMRQRLLEIKAPWIVSLKKNLKNGTYHKPSNAPGTTPEKEESKNIISAEVPSHNPSTA